MIRRWLFWLSGHLPCRLIDVCGKPYLERYALFSLKNGVKGYLHRFVASDDDRFVHDHPWGWAVSLILTGGYTEERMSHMHLTEGWRLQLRRMFPLRLNIIRGSDFHRVVNPEIDTWTLFIHGPQIKPWGFLSKVEAEGRGGVLYSQPQNTEATRGWSTRALPGSRTARTPLGGGARPEPGLAEVSQ